MCSCVDFGLSHFCLFPALLGRQETPFCLITEAPLRYNEMRLQWCGNLPQELALIMLKASDWRALENVRITLRCQSLELLHRRLDFSFSQWNWGKLMGEVRVAAQSCPLRRAGAQTTQMRSCVPCRHPRCRSVHACHSKLCFIQHHLSWLSHSSIHNWAVFPFHVSAQLTLCFGLHGFLLLECPSPRP